MSDDPIAPVAPDPAAPPPHTTAAARFDARGLRLFGRRARSRGWTVLRSVWGARGTITKAALAAIPLVLAYRIVQDARSDAVEIQAFRVSPALADSGVTGDILAQRLKDRIGEMLLDPGDAETSEVAGAGRRKPAGPALRAAGGRAALARQSGASRAFTLGSAAKGVDFEIPKMGVTRSTLIEIARVLLGDHTRRVTGEVMRTPDSLVVSVRVGEADSTWRMPRARLDEAIARAAEFVMRETAPDALAEYYMAHDRARAWDLVRYCLRNGTPDDDAAAYELMGRLYFVSHDPAMAERELRHALDRAPRMSKAMTNLALVYLDQGDLAHAAALFDSAARLRDGDSAKVLNGWGIALDQLGRRGEAKEMYRRAIRADPADASPYANLAALYLQNGAYDGAIDLYRQATYRNPRMAMAVVGWGDALLARGEAAAAAAKYREALRRDPGHAPALAALANMARDSGTADGFRHAGALYDSAAALDTTRAETYEDWGDALGRQRAFPAARELYLRALRLNPNWFAPRLGIAWTYQGEARYGSALRWYALGARAALDHASPADRSFMLEQWGWGLQTAGRLALAEEKFRAAVRQDSTRPGPYAGIAYVLLQRNTPGLDVSYVLAVLDATAKLDPDVLAARGWVLEETGHLDVAWAVLDEAAVLGVRVPGSHSIRGYVRMQQRRFPEALAQFDTAAAEDPHDWNAFVGRGYVLWNGSHDPAAVGAYCRAITEYPLAYDAWRDLGDLRREQRQYALAAADYRNATAADPEGFVGREAAASLAQVQRLAGGAVVPPDCARR